MSDTPGPDAPAPSSFDRVQTRPVPTPRPTKSLLTLPRVAIGTAFIALGIVAAVALWPRGDADGDLLARLDATVEVYTPDIVTTQPAEAQAFVADALGWSIPPPDLPALAIVGVGIPTVASVRPGAATSESPVELPVFRYEGADGTRAHVFVYDYILLDQIGDALDLPDATYAVLSEPVPVDSRVLGDTFVITWRDRAILFSALTDDADVAERIRQAVGS